jgi:hypothetical protein
MTMNSTTQKILAVVLPAVIVLAVLITVKRAKPGRDPGSEFSYTAYAVDEADQFYVFEFPGRGLRWPVRYEGHSLLPLYTCRDCGVLFAGNAGFTAICPECRSHNVGMYAADDDNAIDAKRIRADDLELPGDGERRSGDAE